MDLWVKIMEDHSVRNARIVGCTLLIGLVIAMAYLLVKDYSTTKRYVEAPAILSQVITKQTTRSDSTTNFHQYAVYRFEYNGTEIEASRPALLFARRNLGKLKMIKCDPGNPYILEDTATRFIEVCLLGICAFSLFVIMKDVFRSRNV